MRKTCVVVGLMLALALVWAGTGQAGMWVGAQGGVDFAASTDVRTPAGTGWFAETFPSVSREPAFIGGIIIGYDFVKEGFLGYNYPDWMKYFSFCTDFTYNRHESPPQFVFSHYDSGLINEEQIKMEMGLACWSFLFKARYGFFPDSEVPFGRLQPYIMVGPGIMFSSIRAGFFNQTGFHNSSVDIALVTEAGIRWMALKNVSLDAGFRFRWVDKPSYHASLSFGRDTNVKTELDLFSAMFRVSYHF